MGHRHVFNTSQMFESDSNPGWSHAEQPYIPIARGTETSSITHPVDNMAHQGGYFPSHWTPAPTSIGYSSSVINAGELTHYQPMAPGPSRDPFLQQSGTGNLHTVQNNYSHHSSSNVDSSFYDPTVGSSRGPSYKRKSPGIPPICDSHLASTSSRYYDAGSSSDIRLPADPWQEKQNTESNHTLWDYTPSYGGNNSLSLGGEGTLRNVRSRPAVGMETNIARTQLPTNNSLHQSNSMDFWGQSSNGNNPIPPVAHGGNFGSDSSFFSHDPNAMNTPNNHINSSIQIQGYNNDVTSNRGLVPQNANTLPNQSVRGVRSGYGQSQRSAPTLRASWSIFQPGHVAASDVGQQMVAESHPSRNSRAVSNLRFRNIDRSGRTSISSDRYRSSAEGLMVADHSALYASRTLFDQHRNMRLDIDNMSYEELVALGESIGSVNTGLSDGSISKCLTESIYCSSDISQDEGTCVICLDEYKNMDDVATLKACRHDFHVGCIRKWLSMKNVCPICKSPAVGDGVKDK
ncbi:hypothetical protein ABFS83_10G041800 [Erythranthe nasuta]